MRIEQLQQVVQRRIVTANCIAAVVVLVYLLMIGSSPHVRGTSWTALILGAVAIFTAALALIVIVALRLARRVVERNTRWVTEEREPTPEERRLVLAAPTTFALYPLPFWVLAAIVTALIVPSSGGGTRVAQFVVIVFGGLLTSALTFPLIERETRELTTRALAGSAEKRPFMNMQRRLLLSWALGSGIPLAGIALTPVLRAKDAGVPIAVPIIVLAVAGLAAGFVSSLRMATTVTEPMAALRECFERVQAGELRTSLDVDAVGEIGMLQAGFNQMAHGLLEREHVRDLFGRHVGEEVARAAIEQGVALGGEQRDVSVFFVDLIGSSDLARETSPDRVVALLNRFFAAVVHCVDPEGGWINKFEGDAALCIFGAPNREPEHAALALRAARALSDELSKIGIEAGIGVSSGSVVAGNVGTEARYEYTVIGHPVNEAARITDEAKRVPGRLLASAASIEAAPNEAANWRSDGTRDLRGVGTTEVFAWSEAR